MPSVQNTGDASAAGQRPRRLLQVFNRYLMPGGEEYCVSRFPDHLKLADFEVDDFLRASEEWRRHSAPPRWRQLFLMWNNRRVLSELRALHERVRPEAWILHNVLPVISLGVYRLALELRVPVIQWLHNYRPISPSGLLRAGNVMLQPDDPWLVAREILAGSWRDRFLTAWLALGQARMKHRGDLDAVKAWIAISTGMKSIFEKAGFARENLHLLRHPWDIQPRLDLRDEGHFVFLGRMVDEKGVRFLLNLWRQPQLQNIPLVLCGDGPLADKFRIHTPPNVRWAGFVRGEEKRRLIASSRAVLFPSLWCEPLGMVVYEAYEQARPVLGSDLGGLRDTITDGRTGRLLPAGDLPAWTDAVLQLAKDPEASRTMGVRGLEWLNNNVSPETWARQFGEIFDKIVPANS